MRVSNNNSNKDVDVGNVSRSKRNARGGKLDAQQSVGASGPGDAASVSFSEGGKALSKANKAARSDETDAAKIDRIKAMINDGNYKPDYGKVADRMVNEQLMQELG